MLPEHKIIHCFLKRKALVLPLPPLSKARRAMSRHLTFIGETIGEYLPVLLLYHEPNLFASATNAEIQFQIRFHSY